MCFGNNLDVSESLGLRLLQLGVIWNKSYLLYYWWPCHSLSVIPFSSLRWQQCAEAISVIQGYCIQAQKEGVFMSFPQMPFDNSSPSTTNACQILMCLIYCTSLFGQLYQISIGQVAQKIEIYFSQSGGLEVWFY